MSRISCLQRNPVQLRTSPIDPSGSDPAVKTFGTFDRSIKLRQAGDARSILAEPKTSAKVI
jgi:hypothetical protein